ncbi:coatamer subunit protein [Plectosphaerella plurivora]|uniref:Coatamer subunit protein n=1 Tax=Plectosphaerella plurivora TaxID=936078 RepID=A0A9P8VMH8_9PEZI|nr:coatamer subunit protein [Plectosphaerella plurivora]
MSSKKIAEFPNVEAKLQKPSKQSAFEKQRAEAEAKRAREAAETAAVLKEFEKSFDNDDDYGYGGASRSSSSQGFAPRGPGFGGAPPGAVGRRHFGTSTLKSGPGSLGPNPGLKSGPGSLAFNPGSHGKKRGFDSFRHERDREDRARDERNEPVPVSKAFHNSDDEEGGHAENRTDEAVIPRPTLRLSNIPPGTSQAMIKSLMPANLSVENVKMVPATGPSTERKSTVAIVTLSQETPATDMDAAVSALQRQYLGYGFYLSLHRHLSSTVASSLSAASVGTSGTSQPFGAKPISQKQNQSSAGPQHSFQRGFAPPTSYAPSTGNLVNRTSLLHVAVKPPGDVNTLQLINKTIESVLQHGPEFEALLMSRPEVQQAEKWAWIWDARSEGGTWYRWRLWEVVTGADAGGKGGRFIPLFDGSHAWKAPEKKLAFEYTTNIDEFVSDSEYNSSDEDDDENGGEQDQKAGQELEMTFLNPLDKAKLTHLLSRLPTTLSKIRKGDIARITAFALTHASRGAEEVVDMIVANVEKPFAFSTANRDQRDRENGKPRDTSEPTETGEEKTEREEQDYSGASLVGLYAVSDILSSSSTSGIRHAWRFRQSFESALKERKTFEALGLMATKLRWGRLKAEKWKRSVGMILNLWEGWCVFPVESQELFARTFDSPPSAKPSEEPNEATNKGKWKTVDASTLPVASESGEAAREPLPEARNDDNDDAVGVPMEEDDVEGEPMEEDDVEGEPMEEEDDVEGEPMEDSDSDDNAKDEKGPNQSPKDDSKTTSPAVIGSNVEGAADSAATHTAGAAQVSSRLAGPGRKRMRAVDMFDGSGDSDEGN